MKKAPEQFRLRNHPLLPPCNGNNGPFVMPHYRINGYEIRCIISDGMGFEHVSVTISKIGKDATRCPTWEEMCWVKDMFWNKDEVVIQYHPAEKDYVSQHPYCLHLWKPIGIELPIPDPLMVGIKSNV